MGAQFVFNGTGTRGDLVPLLEIAAEMRRRGHDVHALGNDSGGGLAHELGVPFTAVAPAQTNNLAGVEENFGRHVFASYRPTFDHIEAELARGRRIIVVNSESYAASTLMAERHRLPLCRFILTPFRIFSLEAPFYPHNAKVQGRLGHTYRRYVLPRLRDKRYAHPYILTRINEFRASLGLEPVSSLRALEPLVTHHVCLFPDWYSSPASDWPAPLDCVGFPYPEPRGELPTEVERWLARHGAPFVFTPGTGVVDVQQFFAAAARCCELSGRPGLFLSPHLAPRPLDPEGRILQLDFLELGLVLRRSALLVHHGGIGTTARAIEAGIPQIISPQAFDQPDNGDRVTRLGVGTMLERAQLTGEALAEAAARLLASEETKRTLDDLSARVRKSHAISAMADILERRFLGLRPHPQRRHDEPRATGRDQRAFPGAGLLEL